jgi:2-polyprenyl-6-methoxyphenol hydroxylase-like FAD-dependent oxidoreductase
MPQWHRGRVVLVGDAAYCASGLSGWGTSLALTGTWLLAEAMQRHTGDLPQAFAVYERHQRPRVMRAQATAGPGGGLLVPPTQDAIDARNRRLQRV